MLLVSLAGVAVAACGSSAPGAPPASQGLVLDSPTPEHVALVDQAGRPVSLAAERGRIVVLAPFLSLCQDECPLVTGAFIALQRDLRDAGLAGRVVFVEATVDPGRDSVARLAAYRKEFGADWELWTGSARRRRRLLEALRCAVRARSPRGSRPRRTGGPGRRSPTTSSTPTGTS